MGRPQKKEKTVMYEVWTDEGDFEEKLEILKLHDKSFEKKLDYVIECLKQGIHVSKDHKLDGNFQNVRSCPIKNDLRLIYKIYPEENVLSLITIGKHNLVYAKKNKHRYNSNEKEELETTYL